MLLLFSSSYPCIFLVSLFLFLFDSFLFCFFLSVTLCFIIISFVFLKSFFILFTFFLYIYLLLSFCLLLFISFFNSFFLPSFPLKCVTCVFGGTVGGKCLKIAAIIWPSLLYNVHKIQRKYSVQCTLNPPPKKKKKFSILPTGALVSFSL